MRNMRKLIDANVILRYLLNDVPEMADKAENVIREGAFTIPEVIAEVVYVLSGVYKIDRHTIRNTLTDLLEYVNISHRPVIVNALKLYDESNIDFVYGILISRGKLLGEEVYSFDKKLNELL